MTSQARNVKIVFSDNEVDKAITGEVIAEDEFLISIKRFDRIYRIGKKSIVCLEETSQ